jgi:hypothetical protein
MAEYKIPKTKKQQRVQLNEGLSSKKQELPDARLHQIISFIKSGIRLLGYGALWFSLDIAVILLILSEVVGVKEELV